MKCEEVQARLSWYLDGEAPEIEPHLKGCPECGARLAALKQADALLSAAAHRAATTAPLKAQRIVSRIRRRRILHPVLSAASLLVAAFLGYWGYVNGRTADPQEVLVIGAEKWVAGADSVLRVLVRDAKSQSPVGGARVRASVGKAAVEAVSDADGSAVIRLKSPDASPATLTLEVSSSAGSDTIEREISVERPVRVLLSSDKPLYQPTQTVHLRALALNRFTMMPFEGEVVLEVEDPNGNRVWKKNVASSAFGIAAADFVLADEVTFGTYRLRATAGDAVSERTVEVKRYVLPRFKIELRPDRSFYAPGDTLRADLEARYTFGKPVSQGDVRVELSTWIGDRFEPIVRLSARADENGKASIQTTLPGTFYGIDRERGDAVLRIEAAVTDGAGHVERRAIVSTVTKQPLRLQVFPEAGEWVERVPGRMYVVTSYPDGRPAKTTVELDGGGVTHATDESGVLLLPLRASQFRIAAWDAQGARAEMAADLRSYRAQQDFVLRTDRVSYRAGETLQVSIASASDGVIYLDLVKSDQTILTKSIEVRGGQGKLAIDLPADLFGTVRLSAYRIQAGGQFLRDSRIVIVDLPGDLQIRPTLRKPEFKPGEEIEVDFEVLDSDGKPVTAALGLSVVDEAVFALHESRPGLEKVYFQIEEELLKPRAQLKDMGAIAMATPVRAAVAAKPDLVPLASVSYVTKQQAMDEWARTVNRRAEEIGIAILGFAGVSLLILIPIVLAAKKKWGWVFGYVALGLMVLAVGTPGLLQSQRASNERSAPRPSSGVDFPSSDPGHAAPYDPNRSDLSAPRIRQFFPETLHWNPELITDERGRASLKFPGADSITTWRMAMSAVTRNGRLGSGDQPIRVFQPFFVDIDLPVALTQRDEVWLPVAVYNYLPEPQAIALTFEAESGFEVIGEREKKIDVRPGDVTAIRFHVRAKDFGRHSFLVKAIGTRFSDAVRRSIEVVPDGKEIPLSASNRLTERSRTVMKIPAAAIDGASRLWVRLFPSTFSEIVTGLEGLVRMPYG